MTRRSGERRESYLEQLFHARALVDKGIAPTDPLFEAAFPVMFSLLTDPHITEATVTDVAYLRIQNSAGDWSFALMHPGAKGGCEVCVRTFAEGAEALEKRLALGPAGWRFWSKGKPVVRENGKAEGKS